MARISDTAFVNSPFCGAPEGKFVILSRSKSCHINSKDGNEWQICYSNIRIHYSNVFEYSDREIQLGETFE